MVTKVLIVDDEKTVANLVKEVMDMYELPAEVFYGSAEALDYFKDHADDVALVITDLTMPEINGLEMARIMLSEQPSLSVILCSGYGDEIGDEIKTSGIKAFLQKPVELDELMSTISSFITPQ